MKLEPYFFNIKIYHGKDTAIKIKIPHKEYRQNKNLNFLLINKNTDIIKNGIKKPSGPLVKTAKPEKMKKNKIPSPFLG